MATAEQFEALRQMIVDQQQTLAEMGDNQNALQEKITALEQENQELQAAAASALTEQEKAEAIAQAVAAAIPAPPPKSHAKDLDKVPGFTNEETPKVHVKDWKKNIESTFNLLNTPDNIKTALAVGKLGGKAIEAFNAYTNAMGDTGNRDTTTWAEFSAFLDTLAVDVLVERESLEKEFRNIEQKGSAESFVHAYKALVMRIKNNVEARKLHTNEGYLVSFIQKLKPQVQERMLDKDFATLEDAYREAIRKDNLLFSAQQKVRAAQDQRQRAGGAQAASRTPSLPGGAYNSRAGTPAPPPPHVIAMLAHLGYNWDGTQVSPAKANPATAPGGPPPPPPGGGGGPPGGGPPGGPSTNPFDCNAMEKDHSVKPGGIIPKMTPEIKEWCLKNRACFRCRVPNANHLSNQCPRFRGFNGVEFYDLYPSPESGNDQRSG
mmetsp:Transcript_25053/g.50892  ORF Transcript_25053/g.50892 Transcript_25053/m.50892 type:complete len:434 (-) Transcript_25053:90-1391(-)